MFGPDGAAGLATEIIALAERSLGHEETITFGVAFAEDFTSRRGSE